MKIEDRVIVALDAQDFDACKKLVRDLKGLASFFKVGSELFTSVGADAVRYIQKQGAEVFLDLKFHDIPTTVARSAKAAAALGVKMFNVHALGGHAMMKAAREAVDGLEPRPWILGVTILTSLGERELSDELSIQVPLKEKVRELARLAHRAGLDGVVASAQETKMVKSALGDSFKVVTPGIRPEWAAGDDQKRLVTPKEALDLGADYVVIGRPVTAAKDPRKALARILKEIKSR